MNYVNKMTDLGGNNYNFEIKSWKEQQVDYPKFNG